MTAPAMFRHPEAVAAERGAAGRITPSRQSDKMGRYAGDGFSRLRRAVRNRCDPIREAFGPCRNEGPIEETFLDQNMAHGIEQGDVGPGAQLQMQIGQPRQFGAPGIDDDQRHPRRCACLILAPTTGWDSVGFAPTTMIK